MLPPAPSAPRPEPVAGHPVAVVAEAAVPPGEQAKKINIEYRIANFGIWNSGFGLNKYI
jgi:hypothetical protein